MHRRELISLMNETVKIATIATIVFATLLSAICLILILALHKYELWTIGLLNIICMMCGPFLLYKMARKDTSTGHSEMPSQAS